LGSGSACPHLDDLVETYMATTDAEERAAALERVPWHPGGPMGEFIPYAPPEPNEYQLKMVEEIAALVPELRGAGIVEAGAGGGRPRIVFTGADYYDPEYGYPEED